MTRALLTLGSGSRHGNVVGFMGLRMWLWRL